MSDVNSLYPAPPTGIPEDLAKPSLSYRANVFLLLLLLILFLIAYLGLIAATVFVAGFAVAFPIPDSVTSSGSPWGVLLVFALKISLFLVAVAVSVYLFKPLLRRSAEKDAGRVEITEHEHPELFRFIRRLCDEVRSEFPSRIYVSCDVNASVFHQTSLLNVVVPPRKNLLIGLGLINVLNLIEFKAMLAHEFGHFSQRAMRITGHTMLAYEIMEKMIVVRDRWDELMLRACDMPWLSIFSTPAYMLIQSLRSMLKFFFRYLSRVHAGLSRQMEFNADLVAVGAAGSDAPVHVLLKCEHAQEVFEQTVSDIALAADHGLLSDDLFFHLDQTTDYLRKMRVDPEWGSVPALPKDTSQATQLFEPEVETAVEMWSSHPSHFDREQNAKKSYFRSPAAEGSPWELFGDRETLLKSATQAFYLVLMEEDGETVEVSRDRVQGFIDEERAAISISPDYRGIYDNRMLQIDGLDQLIHDTTSEPEHSPTTLTRQIRELFEQRLNSWENDFKARCEREFDFRSQRFIADFDRSVFRLHFQLARCFSRENEFVDRYRFHLALQRIAAPLWDQKSLLESMLKFLSDRQRIWDDEINSMIAELKQVQSVLMSVSRESNKTPLPNLIHERLEEMLFGILPSAPDLSALTHSSFNESYILKLHEFIVACLVILGRVHLKSLVSILKLQEELVAQTEEDSNEAPGN